MAFHCELVAIGVIDLIAVWVMCKVIDWWHGDGGEE